MNEFHHAPELFIALPIIPYLKLFLGQQTRPFEILEQQFLLI